MKISKKIEANKFALDNYGRRSGKDRRVNEIKGFYPERRVLQDRRSQQDDRRKTIIGRI